MTEKLQKVLAAQGIGSRREIERWIKAGRIKVNGEVAELGVRVDGTEAIELDGVKLKQLGVKKPPRVILYNKPEGEVTSRKDPEGRKTVFERLPKLRNQRWIAVGRLDYNTSGLLLFTTDGQLANALMHPSSNIDREYSCRILGDVDDDMIARLKEGVLLDDGFAQFTDVVPGRGEGANRWYYVALMEGRNREVRRLWESQGVQVSRLKRVRYGSIFMPSEVRQGQWIDLDNRSIRDLYEQCHLPVPRLAKPKPDELKKQQRQHQRLKSQGPKRKSN